MCLRGVSLPKDKCLFWWGLQGDCKKRVTGNVEGGSMVKQVVLLGVVGGGNIVGWINSSGVRVASTHPGWFLSWLLSYGLLTNRGTLARELKAAVLHYSSSSVILALG